MIPKESWLGDAFLALGRQSERNPDGVALLAPGRAPLTYLKFAECIARTQESLATLGVLPDETVALALPNGPELISAALSVAATRPCALLDPALTGPEYDFQLHKLGAGTLIVTDDASPNAVEAAGRLGGRVLRLETQPASPAGSFELSLVSPANTAAPARQIDAALLLFTSATTDAPKLVPLTWRNLRAMAANDSRALELTASDRLLSLMPLFHLHGMAAVLTQLSCGGSVITPRKFDPDAVPGWIVELRPTWLTSNPPISRAIIAMLRQDPQAFGGHALRFVRSGTAASDPELLASLQTALGVPVINGYGMTETGGITRDTVYSGKTGSVGRSSGLDVAIQDEIGNVLPPGVEGEIVVRGASVTAGYLDNPGANAAAFRNGWFRTGDLGQLDADGFLFLTGRLKDMINRGGKKIAPPEVEQALLAHPSVAEAAVCAIPHPALGEDVGAGVVLRTGATATEQELREFASARLAAFKIPRRIAIVDSIPRTANGKPKRHVLAEQVLISTPPEAPPESTLQHLESRIIEIWQRILAVERISPRDDFFAIGGDSLTAAIMLSEVHRKLGTSSALLDRMDFFDNPTAAALAAIVAECGPDLQDTAAGAATRILPLRTTGSRPPLFCFPASARNPYYLRHLAKSLDSEQPFYIVASSKPIRGSTLLSVEELARLSVEAIRRQVPHGPYLIGGHCYGGVIAFEAAQQLIAQGEQVLHLVLFDANTPGYPKVHKHWRRYISKARELAAAFGRGEAARSAAAVRDHVFALSRIFARRNKGTASRALTAFGSDALVTGRQEKELNGMVMGAYNPRRMSVPIVHFIAAGQTVSTEVLGDPRLGWNDFAAAGIEIEQVPGDHASLFAAEHSAGLARLFRRRISGQEVASAAVV